MSFAYSPNRKNAPYSEIEQEVRLEAVRWKSLTYLVQSGCEGRYRNQVMPQDERWAKVTLTFKDQPKVVFGPVDRFPRVSDNLKAIALGMNAIRLNETRGLGDVLRSYYNPNQLAAGHRDPYEVLGLTRGVSLGVIKAAYKQAAARTHPDAPGGSHEAFVEVQQAWEALQKGSS